MKALLLAAGYGTRLYPVTKKTPKCLIEIGGMPLLGHWINLLKNDRIKEILVNTHYLPDLVRKYLKSLPAAQKIHQVHEKILLNTGGTVVKNKEFFGSEPLMLIHADNLSIFNLNHFIQTYDRRQKGIEITMMTFHTDAPSQAGIVKVNNEGKVVAFYEKKKNPPGNLANGAVYIISPEVINFMVNQRQESLDFSNDVIPKFLGKINTFHNSVYHRDIGTHSSLSKARREYSYNKINII